MDIHTHSDLNHTYIQYYSGTTEAPLECARHVVNPQHAAVIDDVFCLLVKTSRYVQRVQKTRVPLSGTENIRVSLSGTEKTRVPLSSTEKNEGDSYVPTLLVLGRRLSVCVCLISTYCTIGFHYCVLAVSYCGKHTSL